ncbi:MAG: hypothetical protein JNL01_00555 [Bdellovibrionales bacterium]|nr:hypothetical protein [Bdellovibrionales bacterium]
MRPKVIRPLTRSQFKSLLMATRKVRRIIENFNIPMHEPALGRWGIHDPPFLKKILHTAKFKQLAHQVFGENVRPTYSFLSMYSDQGELLPHTDQKLCEYSIALCIQQKKVWPLYIEKKPGSGTYWTYRLKPGEAVFYSGTRQRHHRKLRKKGNCCDIALFHFQGKK